MAQLYAGNYDVIKSHVTENFLMTWKIFALSENKRLKYRL